MPLGISFYTFHSISYIVDTYRGLRPPTGSFSDFALYAYAFQIYFDFSGYTDIAMGVAGLLGFRLPENFRHPYLSENPSEFWRLRTFHLAKAYRNDLRERKVFVAAFTAAHVAFRPIHLYYLLDEIAAADPDVVIIGINLRIFSPAGSYPNGRFLNLSRKLSLVRQFQIRESLHEEGVGVLDPAVYRLQEQKRTLYMSEGVHAIGSKWLLAAGRQAGQALGVRPQWIFLRFTREVALSTYDVDPSIHPQAVIAAAILKSLRGSGVSVLFSVSPINPGPLGRLGLLD